MCICSGAGWIAVSPYSKSEPRRWLTRILAGLLSIAVAWVPWALVWGDDFRAAAQNGQATGQGARGAFTVPTTTGDTLQLVPGNAGGDVSYSTLFPGAQSGNPSDFSAFFGNHAGTLSQGQNAQSSLLNDTSAPGTAYRTLRTTVDRSRPDMRQDPLWSQTDEVITNFAEISRTFADCSLSTTFTKGGADLFRHTDGV